MVASIWREARATLELVELHRSGSLVRRGTPRGDGTPVLLIPGYLAGDRSLRPLGRWLRQLGYAPEEAAIAANVDCATRTAERLIARLTNIAATHGDRPLIVGHSLGGVLARLVATRRPDLVRGIVCLGSPLMSLEAVHPLVAANVRVVSALGDLGVPRVLSSGCLDGACCAESRGRLAAPFPYGVGFVSIYSRSDGIVDWRACCDPWADHVEVDSSHIGMPVNTAVYRVLGERLADLRDRRGPRLLRSAA